MELRVCMLICVFEYKGLSERFTIKRGETGVYHVPLAFQ